MKDLAHAAFQQFHADDQHHHRHRQPGKILKAGVAVGVFVVGGAGAQLEADEAHHAGGCVGQVVHRVGGDGDAAREGAGQKFAGAEQQVAENAHPARQIAVGGAHGGVGGVAAVLHKQPHERFSQKKHLGCCGMGPFAPSGLALQRMGAGLVDDVDVVQLGAQAALHAFKYSWRRAICSARSAPVRPPAGAAFAASSLMRSSFCCSMGRSPFGRGRGALFAYYSRNRDKTAKSSLPRGVKGQAAFATN